MQFIFVTKKKKKNVCYITRQKLHNVKYNYLKEKKFKQTR